MIEVRGLERRAASAHILRGVDLTIGRGAVAALIGASGSGKTSLLRCINGLDPFDAGSVCVAGETLTGGQPASERTLSRVRRTVGMVFQGFQLFPHLSVLRNLTLAPQVVAGETAGAASERASLLLSRVGLAGKEGSFPHMLSGGQQQRVAIARALLMRPSVLLLDEPTSALDRATASELLEVLTTLGDGDLTVVIVTHALDFARAAASEMHVIAAGRCVESGSPSAVLDSPQHDATRRLLECPT